MAVMLMFDDIIIDEGVSNSRRSERAVWNIPQATDVRFGRFDTDALKISATRGPFHWC